MFDEMDEDESLEFCVSFQGVTELEQLQNMIIPLMARLPLTPCSICLLENNVPVVALDFRYYLGDEDIGDYPTLESVEKCWNIIDRSLKDFTFQYENVSDIVKFVRDLP